MRNIRVLCVAGNGVRRDAAAEFRVGLRRALTDDVWASLSVWASSHHRLFEGPGRRWLVELFSGQVVQPAIPELGFRQEVSNHERCACCPNKWGYSAYAHGNHGLGYGDSLFQCSTWLGLGDVRRYLSRRDLRERTARTVASDIERLRPHIVIGHSLGSVIAVEALAEARSTTSPILLVTAGAPYAWPRFQHSWSPRARRWMVSPGLNWLNLIDLSDEVTAAWLPPEDFHRSARHVVLNNSHVLNRTASPWRTLVGAEVGLSDCHQVRHYLNHPVVAEAINSSVSLVGRRSGVEQS